MDKGEDKDKGEGKGEGKDKGEKPTLYSGVGTTF